MADDDSYISASKAVCDLGLSCFEVTEAMSTMGMTLRRIEEDRRMLRIRRLTGDTLSADDWGRARLEDQMRECLREVTERAMRPISRPLLTRDFEAGEPIRIPWHRRVEYWLLYHWGHLWVFWWLRRRAAAQGRVLLDALGRDDPFTHTIEPALVETEDEWVPVEEGLPWFTVWEDGRKP